MCPGFRPKFAKSWVVSVRKLWVRRVESPASLQRRWRFSMSTSRSDDNSSFRDELSSGFPGLSEAQLDALCDHYRLLLAWNERLNLTRVTSAREAARIHYVESLFLGAQLPPGNLRVVDVGSGAGFPGIPVGILRPECRVDLVESHQRKAVFLREAIRGLPNVHVLAQRAE